MAQIKAVLTAAAVATTATFAASTGHAQLRDPFGERGQFVLSADRLVPLFSWTRVAQDAFPNALGANVTNQFAVDTQTSFSLFWGSAFTQAPATLFFAIPRVGVDYFVVPHLTVGADLAFFFTVGGSHATETDLANGSSTTTSTSNSNLFVLGFAPRVGYVFRLNDAFSFWPRGGLSFYTATANNPTQAGGNSSHDNVNQLALDLEPQIVYTPVSHFGLTAAIDGDIPLYGRHSHTDFGNNGSTTDSVAANSSVAFFGVTLGMLGYF